MECLCGSRGTRVGDGVGDGAGGSMDGSGYDLSTAEGRNGYANAYGEGALANRLGDMNINLSDADGDSDAGILEASEADTSQVAKSISEKQGGGVGVKKQNPA